MSLQYIVYNTFIPQHHRVKNSIPIITSCTCDERQSSPYVPDSIFETRSNSLAYQFLEGLNIVAHLVFVMITSGSS
jgi:hypothetical protein